MPRSYLNFRRHLLDPVRPHNIHVRLTTSDDLLKIPAGRGNNCIQATQQMHAPIYLSSASQLSFSETSHFSFVASVSPTSLHMAPQPSSP